MITYTLGRLAQSMVLLFVLVTVTFFLFAALPGSPVDIMLGPGAPLSVVEATVAKFGLDQPVSVRYYKYLGSLLRGDLGWSYVYRLPVTRIRGEKIVYTLVLFLPSALLTYSFVIFVVPLLVLRRESRLSRAVFKVIVLLRAAPLFWTSIFAVLIFAVQLHWFPLAGVRTPGSSTSFLSVDFLRHLALPMIVFSGYLVGLPSLLLRARMEEELSKLYVCVALSKGITPTRVVYKHVLRNSLLPIFTTAGVLVGIALGGQLAIEYVFSWPGLGRAIVSAVQTRDFPVAQAVFVLIGVMVIVMNLLVDILYGYVDPRISYD